MEAEFYSTRDRSLRVGLKEAVLRSLPADNGLYMPVELKPLGADFWAKWRGMSLAEIGFEVARCFFGSSVPEGVLRSMVEEAVNFEVPLVEVKKGEYLLELFYGPTLAFKDFGARLMARLMAWLTREDAGELTVLVATSGDTGGAVADAFFGVAGTRVIILYPKGKVSGLQEKQLTTLSENITALEVEGSFDDCQRLVKAAFLERELSEKMNLTSANSINISRLVPQCFYYFEAARQLPEGVVPTFVVPSGNFGNLTAGLLAERLGMRVAKFVAATNRNEVVPEFLRTGEYRPRPSVATISNAMDVGSPSNFARMQEIFGNDWEAMKGRIAGYAFGDEETREVIRRVAGETGYLLEPHAAVGWLAAEKWREANPEAVTVVLGTAHPAKFLDVMEEELGRGRVEVPERLARLAEREKKALSMSAKEEDFLSWLRDDHAGRFLGR